MRSPTSRAIWTAVSPCSTGRSCSIRTWPRLGSSAAISSVWHGESDGAIEHFERAMRLSPLDPETYRMQAGIAMAHLFARRYRRCVLLGGESLPGFAELPHGCEHHCGEPCAGRPIRPGSARHGPFARARSGAAYLQSQRMAADPPAGRSRHLRGRLAESGTAGMRADACFRHAGSLPIIWGHSRLDLGVYPAPRAGFPLAELRRCSSGPFLWRPDLHRVSQEAVLDGDTEAAAS